MKRMCAGAAVLVTILILSGCPEPIPVGDTVPPVADTVPPAATAALEPDPFILVGDSVVVTFSEAMNTTSLTLGGSMAAESDGGVWSGGTCVLTISPLSVWSTGAERTLTVSAPDVAGNPSNTLSLSMQVVDGVIYVRTNGNNLDDGSSTHPLLTIQEAVSQADASFSSAVIKVAGGLYQFDSNIAAPGDGAIILVEGISLRGGYNPADWGQWDPRTWESGLDDTNTDSTGSSATVNLNRTVYAPAGTTSLTRVEGFTVMGGDGDFTTAFLLAGSPTIWNNRIIGGTCPAYTALGETSRGIVCTNLSTPRIEGNWISGGGGGQHARAIEILQANPFIVGNIIYGGQGYSSSTGILAQQDSTPLISNNLIHGGVAVGMIFAVACTLNADARIYSNSIYTTDRGIDMFSSSPDIRNNIILCGAGGRGIIEENACAPRVEDNLIYGGSALYQDNGPTNITSLDTIVTTAASPDMTLAALGNISEDPAFVEADGPDNDISSLDDNDWHLSASSSAAVTQGGQDLSPDVTDDFDGSLRTVPWSIGAYER